VGRVLRVAVLLDVFDMGALNGLLFRELLKELDCESVSIRYGFKDAFSMVLEYSSDDVDEIRRCLPKKSGSSSPGKNEAMYSALDVDITFELSEVEVKAPSCISFTYACIHTKERGNIGVDLVNDKYRSSEVLSDDTVSILE